MRWIAALALVLLVLIGLTVRVVARKPRPVASDEPVEPELRAAPARSPVPAGRSGPRAPRERPGAARLEGRVHLPAGEQDSDPFSGLEVTADDGARSFSGRVTREGHFAFHLPAGRYTLTASVRDLVGIEPDVLARVEAVREVDIRLVPAAAIRGTLRAPNGANVVLSAKPVGGAAEAGTGNTDETTFEVVGLVPGRRYDLTFGGRTVRSVVLREITAPAEGLEIVVDALPVVRGAVGFARGEKCPVNQVGLKGPSPRATDDSDDGPIQPIGPDCRFELSVPENVAEATVVATGPGWLLEETIDIPARGDPAPICLNPPCRENTAESLARLVISLEGAAADSPITAEASSSDEHSTAYHSCGGGRGSCTLDELPAGDTFKVEGSSESCHGEPRTVVLVPGDNFVRLPCHHQRKVEGVVRAAGGEAPERLTVRCQSGGMHALHHTRLFALECGAEDPRLEYQVDRGGPWLSVPLPPAEDPAFVEIGL